MAGKTDTGAAVKFMILGAVAMLAVGALVLGVQHLVASGAGQPKDSAPPVAPAPVDVAANGPVSMAESSKVADAAPAVAPAAPVAEKPKIETPAEAPKAETPAADAPPEPSAEEKAALEAAQRAEELEKERAHMKETFEARKKQVMGIIDTYLALPIDQRPDYLDKSIRELMAIAQAEREAAGLPARPRRGNMMGGEFLKMLGDNATAEEKQKVQTFVNDVIQMQVAKFQAEMAERLKAGGEGGGTVPAPNGR